MSKKTIRLKVPQWQGGNKPTYAFGSELLAWLAPKNESQKVVEIPIPPYEKPLTKENGVNGQSIVAKNVDLVKEAIEQEMPDKIITFGGDCLVSQAPFDYLHGKYAENLGVIWIDAHPDISTPAEYFNEHAMVLGNLLGHGDPVLAKKVQHPFSAKTVLYVGLQEMIDDEKVVMEQLGLDYQIQTNHRLTTETIKQWIKANGFTKIVVHLDLDTLNPHFFRSLYFTEPGVTEFPSESGKISIEEVRDTMSAIAEQSDIVGLTIAEYLPWDAENLKNLLTDFEIFSD